MTAAPASWRTHPAAKPAGQVTRGFTAHNRLRKADTYLAIAHEHLVRTARGLVVDLGYGRIPVTTVEMAARLRRLNRSLRVLGIEIEKERVEAAQAWSRPGTEFRFGGFNLPLIEGERATIVRAMNVLRQYNEAEVATALANVARGIMPGGLLLEGTSNPSGCLLTLNVFRRRLDSPAFDLEEVVFATRPSATFSPRQFQAVLPKTLIHHAEPGGDLDTFFDRWEGAWRAAVGPWSPLHRFARAASALSQHYTLSPYLALHRRGFLAVRPPWPSVNLT